MIKAACSVYFSGESEGNGGRLGKFFEGESCGRLRLTGTRPGMDPLSFPVGPTLFFRYLGIAKHVKSVSTQEMVRRCGSRRAYSIHPAEIQD